jgi:hypothetical protein
MSEHAQVNALFPTLVYSAQLDDSGQYNQSFLSLMDKYGFDTDGHTDEAGRPRVNQPI